MDADMGGWILDDSVAPTVFTYGLLADRLSSFGARLELAGRLLKQRFTCSASRVQERHWIREPTASAPEDHGSLHQGHETSSSQEDKLPLT